MKIKLKVVKESNWIQFYYGVEFKPISYDVTDGEIPLEALKRIAYVIKQDGIVNFTGFDM